MATYISEKAVDYQIRITYFRGTKGVRIVSINEKQKVYLGRLEKDDPPSTDDLDIKIANPLVSRSHLQFRILEKVLCVRDTKSSKGTFLNKTRLSPALEESDWVEVVSGDEICLGQDKVIDNGNTALWNWNCIWLHVYNTILISISLSIQ